MQAGHLAGSEEEVLHEERLARPDDFSHEVVRVRWSVGTRGGPGAFDDRVIPQAPQQWADWAPHTDAPRKMPFRTEGSR
eukprot:12685466-Alexandrium_andersonii.AAC.1